MTGLFHAARNSFRDADATDIQELTLLAQQSIALSYVGSTSESDVVEFIEDGMMHDYVSAAVRDAWCPILMLDRVPAAFAVCREDVLDLLVVDFRYQRCGWGTELLRFCESQMFRNYPSLITQCFSEDVAATHFITRNGWKPAITFPHPRLCQKVVLFQKRRRAASRRRIATRNPA